MNNERYCSECGKHTLHIQNKCAKCGTRNPDAKSLEHHFLTKGKPDLNKLDLDQFNKFPHVREDKTGNRVIEDGDVLMWLYRLEAKVPLFAEGEVPDLSYRADNI